MINSLVFLLAFFVSFFFLFINLLVCGQIMERILLSSRKTCLHDDVLQILSMHLDPILPLPRPRMLSVKHSSFIA